MTQLTVSPPEKRRGLNEDGRRRLVQVFAMVGVYALFLFIPAGTLRWPNAWVYLLMFLVSILTAGMYVARRNPDIINERGRPSEKTKPFDRLFGRLTIPLGLAVFVVAGLDFRFGWSQMPLWLEVVGFIMLVPGMLMPYWVMLVNSYAATTVRIETERGQHVITGGPYRFVRHPMYATAVLSYLFVALALGSWWAYIPALAMIALLVWRTANEDRTLQAELPGYKEFTQETRFRLLPGVW